MSNETVAFYGPVVGLVLGMVVMILGVLQGGINPVLIGGSTVMVLSVGWLSMNVGNLPGDPSGH
jgi:hypothetical protein